MDPSFPSFASFYSHFLACFDKRLFYRIWWWYSTKQYSNHPLDGPIQLFYFSDTFAQLLVSVNTEQTISLLCYYGMFLPFSFSRFFVVSVLLSVDSLLSSCVIWLKLEKDRQQYIEREGKNVSSVQNNWFCFQLHILTFRRLLRSAEFGCVSQADWLVAWFIVFFGNVYINTDICSCSAFNYNDR